MSEKQFSDVQRDNDDIFDTCETLTAAARLPTIRQPQAGASITQMDSDSETKDGKILQCNRLQLHCSLCGWATGLSKPSKARQKIMDHTFNKHLHTNGLDEVHTEISEETDSHDNIADQKIPSTDNVLEETPEIENYIQKIYNIKKEGTEIKRTQLSLATVFKRF